MQLTISAAAALLATLPSALAASANVINNCDFDVYLWSVSAESYPSTPTCVNGGSSYSEQYQTPSSGGVSLKLATKDDASAAITQFEYTLDGCIWYDLSNINCVADGCPFEKYGMYMEGGPGCPTRTCDPGVALCTGAYNAADDNQNSLSCSADEDITLYLCSTNGSNVRRGASNVHPHASLMNRAINALEGRASPIQHAHRRIGHPHWRH